MLTAIITNIFNGSTDIIDNNIGGVFMNTKLQKDIKDLFKKLGINNNTPKGPTSKKFYDYKLQTKFPSKFSNGNLSITNSTK